MKKILLAGVILGALALTSCKKDWDCHCKGTILGMSFDEKIDTGFSDMSRKDARKKCKDSEKELKGYGDASCNLKSK